MMRRKLTELISTPDQYNGMGKYSDQYEAGDQVDIRTDLPGAPDKATISESRQKLIRHLVFEGKCMKKFVRVYENKKAKDCKDDGEKTCETAPIHNYERYVLSFDEFVRENFQVRPPQAPDYDDRPKGWRNDEWEDEDESENEEE